MAAVSRLRQAGMTVEAAVDKYLAHVHATKSARTWRAYGLTFRQFCGEFGALAVDELDPDAVAEWFTGRWGAGSAQGWNANRAALTSAAAWWRDQPDIPVDTDPFSRVGRRAIPPDRSRALDRAAVERLITSPGCRCGNGASGRLLYDSAARSAEVLRLDVPDLDLANHRARVTRKGGGHDVVIWKTRTARLLSNYLEGRRDGPVFVTERGQVRRVVGPADRDERGRARLSYERAEALFRDWSAALPAGRDVAPAAALRADPRCGGRGVGADADDEERARVRSGRWASTPGRALRRWPGGSRRRTGPAAGATDGKEARR